MTFAVVLLLILLTRQMWRHVLPWRLISVSTINLAALLVFIGLGLEYMYLTETYLGLFMVLVFYQFLLFGEYLGNLIKVNHISWSRLGNWFNRNFCARIIFFLVFWIYCLMPLVTVLIKGQSIPGLLANTWASYGVTDRATRLVEGIYARREENGTLALLRGIEQQLVGFWYLAIGIVWSLKPRMAIVGLLIYLFGQLLISGGARSGIFIAIGMIVILRFLSGGNEVKSLFRWDRIILIFIIAIGSLLMLDYLLMGRSGLVATGTVSERISRVLQKDFALGGLGIDFATHTRPPTIETGVDYLFRLLTNPVPRALWPTKYIVDPNLEMTEQYTGMGIESVRTIYLFTPIGEALFYFGYVGLLIIPMMYGFLTTLLERIYRTSPVYGGLLAQVYVWAFLAMRHTFWNLWSALVVVNFLLLVFLFFLKTFFFTNPKWLENSTVFCKPDLRNFQ